MVSAGPLLLLLMSTSFVLSSPGARPSTNQQDGRSLQKRGQKTRRFLTVVEYTAKISKALSPFIGLIPVAGQYINLVLGISEAIAENTKKDETLALLKFEFQNLQDKLDKYHREDNWKHLTESYQNYENSIKSAWNQFKTLEKDMKTPDKAQREKFFKNFKKPLGDNCKQSTHDLYTSLTSKKPSFNTNFGKGLIDFSRCHENIIKEFTILINELFWAGITVTHFINQKDNIDKSKELADMAFKSGSIMFEIHKHCITESEKYIRLDVKDLIDEGNDRGKLAKTIRMFLEKEFDRYDWMVVAFLTKHSSHSKLKSFNIHTLSDAFIREEKGEVTVAVAKQVKGTHTKAAKVQAAIEKCLGDHEHRCKHVIKTLESCEETVESVKVKETYTAVHTFISESHESVNALQAKDAPEEGNDLSNQASVPYIYSGKCKKTKAIRGGHFNVLIKRDEDIMKESPCVKLDCGKDGKCEPVGKTLIPVCMCNEGFYGEKCEESVDDYIKHMQGKTV